MTSIHLEDQRLTLLCRCTDISTRWYLDEGTLCDSSLPVIDIELDMPRNLQDELPLV